MKRKLSAGLTGASLPIFVRDTSSTTGAGLGSLVFNTAGLVAEYRRQGAATFTAITLSAGTLGTWSSGGFVASGALTGRYEVDIPDAALASGARWVEICYRGAANMLPVLIEIELDVVNYQSATAFMTGVNSLAPPANWNTDVVQTGDAFARLGAAGAGLTALGDTRIANLDATVSGVPAATLDLANGIETSMTLRQAMRALVAMGVGKSTETAGTLVFKRQDGTTTAFTIVHDSLGSRTGSSIGSL